MNRNRHESIGLGNLVTSLDSIADFDADLRRLPCVLTKWKHQLIGIGHAPNGEMAGKAFLLGRMHAMPEPRREFHHRQLNFSARLTHFARSFSFGLSGEPG